MKLSLNTVSAVFSLAFLSPAAATLSVTYWQRDISVSTPLLSENTSSAATGDVTLGLPSSPGGGSGQDFELTVAGAQTTTVTVTPNAMSLLGQGSVSSGATVTYPNNMYAEGVVLANTLFKITEKAEFSLYGVFSGGGSSLDHHLMAALFKASGTTPSVAIGYFQDGASNLPGAPLTGILEPGEYFFTLSLRSRSTAAPADEGQTVTENWSGEVNSLAFSVREIPEPSVSLIAAGGLLMTAARRRRFAAGVRSGISG